MKIKLSTRSKISSATQYVLDWIFESPTCKTIFSYVLPLASGILSGTFVSEITVESSIEWSKYSSATSFYGLAALGLLLFFYNRAMYDREVSIKRFSDDEYCIAYVRSRCLPEAADRARELIRKGRIGDFRRAMQDIKRGMR